MLWWVKGLNCRTGGLWCSTLWLPHSCREIIYCIELLGMVCFINRKKKNKTAHVARKSWKMNVHWLKGSDGTKHCLGPVGSCSLLSVPSGNKGSLRSRLAGKCNVTGWFIKLECSTTKRSCLQREFRGSASEQTGVNRCTELLATHEYKGKLITPREELKKDTQDK